MSLNYMSESIDNAALTAAVSEALRRHRDRPGPLLEVLHSVQQMLGFIPPAAVPLIAQGLNLSRAEVHGVVTFYHSFRSAPAGRRVLRICRAEACQAAGGNALQSHAQERTGLRFGDTAADGSITLEAVYCLGLCSCAPAAMLDDTVHGRVTPQRLDEILAAAASTPP